MWIIKLHNILKTVHVFVPVFLNPVTMLIFQIKRIISSEKWVNYLVTIFFFLKMPKDDGKRRKKKRMASLWNIGLGQLELETKTMETIFFFLKMPKDDGKRRKKKRMASLWNIGLGQLELETIYSRTLWLGFLKEY